MPGAKTSLCCAVNATTCRSSAALAAEGGGLEAVGDVFRSHLWPGPQTIVRIWHIKPPVDPLSMGRREPPPGGWKVSLRHGPSGVYILLCNGLVFKRSFEQPFIRSFTIDFTLPATKRGVSIDCVGTSSIGFTHTLRLDGQEVAELRSILDPSLGEALPHRAGITDTRCFFEGKKKVVVYQLFVEPGLTDSEETGSAAGAGGSSLAAGRSSMLIERRYSEFVALDLIIRAATDAHLLSSLPSLPGKVFNPMTDQVSEAFISSRREALNAYLQQILNNGKVRHYQEVSCFLGLDPITGHSLSPSQVSDAESDHAF